MPSRPSILNAPLQVRPLSTSANAVPLIHAAPSFVPVRAYPAFWPQFGYASMFGAGSNWYQCAATRSGMFVPAYLPATGSPFASPACGQDWSAVGDADGITTLTPGQNKDALYGPAYTPRDLGTP